MNRRTDFKSNFSDLNMLQESISKIDSLIDPQDIFVITSAALLNPIRNSLPELPPENIIAEPAKRNTAPCLALGSAIISARYKDLAPSAIVTAVLTADHKIEPKENFSNCCRSDAFVQSDVLLLSAST